MNETFAFVVCVPSTATAAEKFVVTVFGTWPLFVTGFGNVVILFDQSVFMILTSLLVLFLGYSYLKLVADAVAFPRDPNFDFVFCRTTEFAFPDPLFVSVMIFTLVVILGIYFDKALHLRVGTIRATIIILQIAGYLVTTLISGYFTPLLLAINSLLVLVLSLLYWALYKCASPRIWNDAKFRGESFWLRAVAFVLGASLADDRDRRSLSGLRRT